MAKANKMSSAVWAVSTVFYIIVTSGLGLRICCGVDDKNNEELMKGYV